MKKILVVVDMQNDFINGPLKSADCEQAVFGCVNLCENGEFDHVIFTRDTHFENYPETLEGIKLPVTHCIEGTDGWQIINELQKFTKRDNATIIDKYTFGSVALPTLKGDMQDLHGVIDAIVSKPTKMVMLEGGSTVYTTDDYELHFAGVCTSICVLSNMAIQRAYYPEMPIYLHRNATGDVKEEMRLAAFVCAKAIQCEVVD